MSSARPLYGQNVIVLAQNFQLTTAQYNLLNKGLSFIPTVAIHKNEKLQLEMDLQNYHRRIKLATYFRQAPKKDRAPFIGPSNWTPPFHLLPLDIQQLIHWDQDSLKKHYKLIHGDLNIPSEEIHALRELKSKKQIVIKPADKGSAVVVLGREQYIQEVERQLNDTVYYKKLTRPIYLDTVPLVRDILDNLKKKKYINHRQRQYLAGQTQPRERRFYILPKIHKKPESWPVPHKIPPGRPIVSDCGSETYYTAEYLDYFLNPLSTKHPSYVQDTYAFIQLIKSIRIPSDFHFFTMDVDNLYTNIPIEAGIDCVKQIFLQNPDPQRPDDELIELLRINLTRNDFVFEDNFYLQVKGTAMGKRFAPAYANIFMANWEREALAKCPKKPAIYVRYLDDIFGIWLGSRQEFDCFVNLLNSHDPSIQLKVEVDQNSINFLDTTVFRGPKFNRKRRLDIKVFFKPTDTHALLQRNSHHPKHTFRGIVKSQLIRFKRICTRSHDFWQAVGVLFRSLRRRGYTRPFLRNCLKTFQVKRERPNKNFIPLITTFSLAASGLNSKFKTNFQKMSNRETLIPNSSVISAYKRNKNLNDWLVRAKLPSLSWEKPLKRQKYFYKLKFIKNSQTKIMHKIQQEFTLRSKNCVYVIFCLKCQIKYVGETKNCLSIRLSQHLHNIRHKKETNTLLVQHFLQHGAEFLRMSGLEGNVCWTDRERKGKERYWIFTVGTREPGGLNMKKN